VVALDPIRPRPKCLMSRPSRRRFLQRLGLGSLALLAACTLGAPPGSQAPGPPGAPVPARPPALQPVRIGVPGPSLSYLPGMVAVELGLYRDEGLDVEFVHVGGGDLAVAALLSGEMDYTTIVSAGMSAIAKGAPLRVVHYQSIKLQHVLVARPEIATIKDLSGKRLGVQRLGDLTAHEAVWVSEHYGLVNLMLLQAGSDVERLQGLIA